MRTFHGFVILCALSVTGCPDSEDSDGGAGTGGASVAGTTSGGSGTSGAAVGGSLVAGSPSSTSSGGSAGSAVGGRAQFGGSAGLGTSAGAGAVAGAGFASAGAAGSAGTSVGGGQGGSAQAGAAGATTAPPLRITSDTASIEFTPVLIAAQDFYPGKATVGSGGIPTLLTNSDVDLGTNAETQTLRQSVDHPNVRIIFTVTETFYRIIASRKAGIATLTDLRGKRIGTIPNTSAAYYVDKTLRTVGLTDGDITIVSGGICMRAPCGMNTLAGLLQRGSVDAVTLWEPTARLAADAIGDDAIEFQDRKVYREIVNLHTTAEKLADPEKRRGIVEFVRALAKAQELYRTHPEEVRPRISQAIGVDVAVLEEVWEDEQWLGTLVPDILDVLVEEDVWVAKERNRTPRTREQLAVFVDDSIMKEALGK